MILGPLLAISDVGSPQQWSLDDGLGFRERDELVKLSAEKHRKRHNLPRFGPSVGDKTYPYLSDLD
jgi:hypothetical protein